MQTTGSCVVMECPPWYDARAKGSGLGCQTSTFLKHSAGEFLSAARASYSAVQDETAREIGREVVGINLCVCATE